MSTQFPQYNPFYHGLADSVVQPPLVARDEPGSSAVFLSPRAEGFYQSGATSGALGANRRLEANQLEENFLNGISEFRVFLQNRKYDEQTLSVLTNRSKLSSITDPAEKEKIEKAIAETDSYIRSYLGKEMLDDKGNLNPVMAEYAVKVASTLSNSEIRQRMSQVYLSGQLQMEKIKNKNDYWEAMLKAIADTVRLASSSGNGSA